MKYQAKLLYEKVEKSKDEVTSDELISFCYDDIKLPKNKSDIYSLISILKVIGVIEKKKNGLYKVYHSRAVLLDE